MNWSEILHKNMPDAQWSIPNAGSDKEIYEGLIFHDKNVKPIYTQFEAWQIVYDKEMEATEYQRNRKKEYPSFDELLIALWEKDVEGRPEESVALEVKRQAVKQKYPKPVR
jgi:hypothetical protein